MVVMVIEESGKKIKGMDKWECQVTCKRNQSAEQNCKFWNINSANFANSDKNIPFEMQNQKKNPSLAKP